MLNKIKIILVKTTHPGNIGAAARAMKNMGLKNLVLVAPQCNPNSEEAVARAKGADDVLINAQITQTLEEALENSQLIFATSARQMSLSWPIVDVRQAANEIACKYRLNKMEVAILFGPEHSGLTNEDRQKCHYLLQIPVDTEYGSLNIAQAVQIVAYELRMAKIGGATTKLIEPSDELPAVNKDIELFYQHLERILVKLSLINPKQPKQLMARLRRLFSRIHLTVNEVGILRGILNGVEKKQYE